GDGNRVVQVADHNNWRNRAERFLAVSQRVTAYAIQNGWLIKQVCRMAICSPATEENGSAAIDCVTDVAVHLSCHTLIVERTHRRCFVPRVTQLDVGCA